MGVNEMDLQKIKSGIVSFYKKFKKWVWVGGGALVLLILGFAVLPAVLGKNNSNQVQAVYASVTKGDITESIDVVGSLEAQPTGELTWESGGIVKYFDIKVGDLVEKGDILMSLDESSLSSSILQAHTDLLTAQANLQDMQAANTNLYSALQTLSNDEYTLQQYASNRAHWNVKGSSYDAINKARSDYYAAKELMYEKDNAYQALVTANADSSKQAAAYKDYQDAVAGRDKALRVLNNLLGTSYSYAADSDFILYDQQAALVEQDRIDYNRYLDQSDEISAAQANVQALENTINQANIIAPFNGTVTEISAVPGDIVASGDSAVRLDDLSNLVVNVSVSEVDINRVKLGQTAAITFDALPNKTFNGQVVSISSAGDNSSGTVEFAVNVKVLDADENVKPGFTAVVSIITSQVKDALLVPNDAVITRNGNTLVMVAGSDGTLTPVQVQTGASTDTETQIVSGDLKQGEQVAVFSSSSNGSFFGGGFPGGFGGQFRVITGGGGEQARPSTRNNNNSGSNSSNSGSNN